VVDFRLTCLLLKNLHGTLSGRDTPGCCVRRSYMCSHHEKQTPSWSHFTSLRPCPSREWCLALVLLHRFGFIEHMTTKVHHGRCTGKPPIDHGRWTNIRGLCPFLRVKPPPLRHVGRAYNLAMLARQDFHLSHAGNCSASYVMKLLPAMVSRPPLQHTRVQQDNHKLALQGDAINRDAMKTPLSTTLTRVWVFTRTTQAKSRR
jgi:hypothetical protein